MVGGPGADDIVGGGSSNLGEVDAPDRIGDGLLDDQDTLYGDDADTAESPATDGGDVVTGDNARVVRPTEPLIGLWRTDEPRNAPLREIRLFDVQTSAGPTIDPATSAGELVISGHGGNDQLFGQGGDNVIDAGTGDDYAEGNHGANVITGGPGPDDLIGGGSSANGAVGPDSVGNGLLDAADTIHGDGLITGPDDGGDVIAGDNASIVRPTVGTALTALLARYSLAGSATGSWIPDPNRHDEAVRQIHLFNVRACRDPPRPRTSGGDTITGTGGADQLFGQGDDDTIDAGDGDDYAEGNHGGDTIDGSAAQDDLIGGSSAGDGLIGAGTAPTGLTDGDDTIHGNDGSNVALGDHGDIVRAVDADGIWQTLGDLYPTATKPDPALPDYDTMVVRDTSIAETPEPAGAFGDDTMIAGNGEDAFIGQQGDDHLEGNAGDDVLLGDLGHVTTILEDGSRARHVSIRQPFLEANLHQAWTLTHAVTLFHDVVARADDPHADPSRTGAEGDDVPARGLSPTTSTVDRATTSYGDGAPLHVDTRPGLEHRDNDHLWGGDGRDALWGGRGPDDVFGGYGDDHLYVYPREATATTPRDPQAWFDVAGHDVFQGLDYLYGGWDQDAMQADLLESGPRSSDRLIDSVGAYNVYYVCDGPYGEGAITRALAPQVIGFLETLSDARGAVDASTPGTSGFRETGIVSTRDIRYNQAPVHPDNPGHFTCNGTDVLSGPRSRYRGP